MLTLRCLNWIGLSTWATCDFFYHTIVLFVCLFVLCIWAHTRQKCSCCKCGQWTSDNRKRGKKRLGSKMHRRLHFRGLLKVSSWKSHTAVVPSCQNTLCMFSSLVLVMRDCNLDLVANQKIRKIQWKEKQNTPAGLLKAVIKQASWVCVSLLLENLKCVEVFFFYLMYVIFYFFFLCSLPKSLNAPWVKPLQLFHFKHNTLLTCHSLWHVIIRTQEQNKGFMGALRSLALIQRQRRKKKIL